MGSGKTTVGRLVAAALAVPLLDSDEVLADRYGATAATIQARAGADALHELESSILLEQLTSDEPTVIGAAASTVEDERVLAALRERAFVAVLTGTPELLASRARSSPHRPLPADPAETVALLTEQLERRGPLMAAAADLVLDVVHPPRDLAGRIVDAWRALGTP